MPFGLDIKSIALGVIIALWVWPMVMGMLSSRKTGNASA